MVEVFKTNVNRKQDADEIITMLMQHFPHYKINFDLDDCDKILRVEADCINPDEIIELLEICNLQCEILEDIIITNEDEPIYNGQYIRELTETK